MTNQSSTQVEEGQGSVPSQLISLDEALARFVKGSKYTTHTAKNGSRRYKFEGLYLAETSSRWQNGREQNRWSEETLYAVKGGGYLVAHEYVTCWQGEANEHSIHRHENLEGVEQDLLDDLRTHLCEELGVKIPLADIAEPLENLPQ